jgi:hypothetical protein
MLYLGADLSYVNEMVDCGGIYRSNGVPVEPYQFFSEKVPTWYDLDYGIILIGQTIRTLKM